MSFPHYGHLGSISPRIIYPHFVQCPGLWKRRGHTINPRTPSAPRKTPIIIEQIAGPTSISAPSPGRIQLSGGYFAHESGTHAKTYGHENKHTDRSTIIKACFFLAMLLGRFDHLSKKNDRQTQPPFFLANSTNRRISRRESRSVPC